MYQRVKHEKQRFTILTFIYVLFTFELCVEIEIIKYWFWYWYTDKRGCEKFDWESIVKWEVVDLTDFSNKLNIIPL